MELPDPLPPLPENDVAMGNGDSSAANPRENPEEGSMPNGEPGSWITPRRRLWDDLGDASGDSGAKRSKKDWFGNRILFALFC